MPERGLYITIAVLLVVLAGVVVVGMTSSAVENPTLDNLVDAPSGREARSNVEYDGPGRENVSHYNAPSTQNLAGFKGIKRRVDGVAQLRTYQANKALEIDRPKSE